MVSRVLDCDAFKGNNPLTGEIIWKHRVFGGSEAIKEKLKELYLWDGTSNIATIAAKLKDGKVETWHLYLFGRTKGIKVDSSTFFVDQEEGNTLRIQEMDLDSLIFQGGMVSEWLSPDKYKWEFRLPHEEDPKRYHRVKTPDLAQYNAKPLWMRSATQVVPGPKLSVLLGVAPADQITEIPGSTQGQFPLIFVEKFSVPFLPFESSDMELGMGPIPFLIDDRQDLDFSEVGTSCPDGQTLKLEMAKYLQSAMKPNQKNEVKTWLKEVGAGNWVTRAPAYTVPDPRALEGDHTNNDEEEDDTG
jgi:hypothetical protein